MNVASAVGIGSGGLLLVVSGYVPWWRENYGIALTGLDFARGQAVVGLGCALIVIGMARAMLNPSAACISSIGATAVAVGAIVVAGLEEQIARPGGYQLIDSRWHVQKGYYLALCGGIIAFVGSLLGLLRYQPTGDTSA